MTTLLQQCRLHQRHFPLASPSIARRQGIKLTMAKKYLSEHGIDAVKVGSKFEYHLATGSVLK